MSLLSFTLSTAEKEALAKKSPESVTEIEKEQVANHPVELKQADMNLILQLDQLVADQQGTLEKAGSYSLILLILTTFKVLIVCDFLNLRCSWFLFH